MTANLQPVPVKIGLDEENLEETRVPPTPADHRTQGAGLKKKAVRGGMWTGVSFAGGQGLAFVSNILLSYLLVPEVFGLMALLTTIVAGLQMFSDVGITPSLIQNKREDPGFYNTAWTMQVVRGVLLWGAASLVAWPLSTIKDDWAPLAYLLPVASLTCVLNGLRSTAWVTASRRLDIRAVALLKLFTSIVRILVMVGLAYFVTRTVWALVVGLIVGSTLTCILSHRMIPEIKNRLHFEKEAFTELIRFGKWMFLSTLITFFAGQIDKFLLAGLISTGMLGLFWIASRLADLGPMFFKQLAQWVGFPALSELYRRDEARFKSRLLQMRLVLTLPIVTLLLLMILIGPIFTNLVYAPRYGESGWIVQIIAFGSLAGMVTTPYGQVYMATGRSKYNMLSVLAQLICMLTGTLTGYWLAGEAGFLLGIGACQWLRYVADAALVDRCGCWQWKFDAAMLIGGGLLAWCALWGSQWLAWRYVL
ncbi:MAG: oligosaccharide flippase family protein [Planctomycetota bacterium]